MKANRIALLFLIAFFLTALPLAAAPFVADPAATDVSIDITANAAAPDPNDITVYVGQHITLNVTNAEFVAVSGIIFRIDEFDIKKVIKNKKTETFTFTPDKPGEFLFKSGYTKGVIKVLPLPVK